MTELIKTEVHGGYALRGAKKGGGGARTPVEAPDSLHSTQFARVLDLLGEGEIVGLVNGANSIKLNKTPLQNSDGTLNFAGVTVDFRAGTQHQSYIPGFPAAENPISVGVELTSAQPWVIATTNLQLSAVRVMLGVNGLSKADTSNGDINGYRVEYAIDLQTDAGPWVEVVRSAFDGKTTDEYRRSHRIDLPPATAGWQTRVRRATPNANSSTIADVTIIDTFTEVTDGKMRYPMSALVGIQIDASQFNSIPTRAYHVRGKIIRVPSNYDPATRIYTGIWDGLFKNAWTNNPAWIFYDILTNDRYGLGRQIPAAWVNKWELYRIGRYCDELIPDGRGGQEPRFTCNVYLQSRGDAFRVLSDLVTTFRGIMYWAAGSAIPVADMPRDIAYSYTQANVINGDFTYTGTRRKDRPTIAVVSYNDPQDGYRQKTVTVQDQALVSRYGIRKTEIASFGCTSEGQATRIGKWALLTASRETRGVTFAVGLDGTICTPGQLIQVADNRFAGARLGGRIRAATRNQIELDSDALIQYGDMLSVLLPDGTIETRKISASVGELLTADDTKRSMDMTDITADAISLAGTVQTVTMETPFSQVPIIESVWALETGILKTQLFTVTSITEGDSNTFNITAVQHEPGKFENIDYGTKLDERPITVVPPSVQAPPSNVRVSDYSFVDQGIESRTGVIEWDGVATAAKYEIEWRRDSSNWVRVPAQANTRVELPNIYTGTYIARVRALDAIGTPSLWVYSVATDLVGTLSAPPSLTSLTATGVVFGINLKWGFPNVPNIIQRTEIWYGPANNLNNATKLTDLAYPQNTYNMQGLAAGVAFFFWGRVVDKNGLVGPWTPLSETNGVRGASSSDASAILEYLEGQIMETQLAQSLIEKIESSDGSAVEIEAIRNDLAAMYTIKTQLTVGGVPYLAGIGVGVENNEGIITSQILLAAQRVAVINEANGQSSVPFVIQNGQVFMNSAFIANASIGSAQIADWLYSDAFNPLGQRVWQLNLRTGEMQFNGPAGAIGRLTMRNDVIEVYDANNVRRVQMGRLA